MQEQLSRLRALTAGGDLNRAHDTVGMALAAIREHLKLDVAYVSEFVNDTSVFRIVDAPGLDHRIKVGDVHLLSDLYCRHIREGRLPELMSDTGAFPLASELAITRALPIGAHVSVPIARPDGSTYGMFCCFGFEPNRSFNERDLEVTKAFADIAARQIGMETTATRELAAKRDRIEKMLATLDFTIHLQPIWSFLRKTPKAFESLVRFAGPMARTPDIWFAEAADVGLRVDLELAVLRHALDALDVLPSLVRLSINASPEAAIDQRFGAMISGVPLDRLILEITEHARIEDYEDLVSVLAPFRDQGMALAVDDAGAGYACFQHIITLKPDIIKLDMTLTRSIDSDAARRALASALIFFARETGAELVAEGIETEAELQTLKVLGIHYGQGYLLGRPTCVADAVELVSGKSSRMAR